MKNTSKNKIEALIFLAINEKFDLPTSPEIKPELKLTLLALKEKGLVKSSTRCVTKKSAAVAIYRERFVLTERGIYTAKMLASVIENL